MRCWNSEPAPEIKTRAQVKNLLSWAKIWPDQGTVMKRPRRNHMAAFKAKVALAALKDDKTLADLAEKFDEHSNQISQCRAQLLEAATGVFLTPGEKRESVGPSVKDMQAKIGQLALENDFLAGALGRIEWLA